MSHHLRLLVSLRHAYSPADAAAKLRCLEALAGAELPTPGALVRYHEALLWTAAYPDDAALLARARRSLDAFAQRADLARHRDALDDSGLAGTRLRYRYFWMSLRHLARQHPDALTLDWDAPEFEDRLRAALPFLLRWDVAEAVRRAELPVREVIDRLRGPQTDAAYLAGCIERFSPDTVVQEQFHEAVDAAYVLHPKSGTPSRTTARWHGAPVTLFDASPARPRPDLRAELARPPRAVHTLTGSSARRMLDLARGAMITRQRDLAAFAWGSSRDVRLVDDGPGLSFAMIGTEPSRRLPLPAVYGWIMLRNGVPVGYVQTDSLVGGAEVSFNTFPTFRGAEASYLFARVLAVSHHLLGARAFSIEPYQLGHGNDEGIETGAFWFYQKLGFAPRAHATRDLVARELAAMTRRPSHRSSPETLAKLARTHLYWEPFDDTRAWLPAAPSLGLRLAATSGDGAARALGVTSFGEWSRDERRAWERLAPVIAAMDVSSWSDAERADAVEVVRAKGRPLEAEFVRRLDAHPRLRDALIALLRG